MLAQPESIGYGAVDFIFAISFIAFAIIICAMLRGIRSIRNKYKRRAAPS